MHSRLHEQFNNDLMEQVNHSTNKDQVQLCQVSAPVIPSENMGDFHLEVAPSIILQCIQVPASQNRSGLTSRESVSLGHSFLPQGGDAHIALPPSHCNGSTLPFTLSSVSFHCFQNFGFESAFFSSVAVVYWLL